MPPRPKPESILSTLVIKLEVLYAVCVCVIRSRSSLNTHYKQWMDAKLGRNNKRQAREKSSGEWKKNITNRKKNETITKEQQMNETSQHRQYEERKKKKRTNEQTKKRVMAKSTAATATATAIATTTTSKQRARSM